MNFSFIIINYNTFEYTRNCLESIFRSFSAEDYEIIVIDNASLDNSGKRLEEIYRDRVKFILNQHNAGFGAANNLGAKVARGTYLWFLNSDTLINKVSLAEIDKLFLDNNKLGVVSVDLLLESGQRQAYAFGDFLTLGNLIKRSSNVGKEQADYFDVQWVSGAAMIARKELFDKLGGFDENFFMYFEDMDLCWRIRKIGYQIWFLKNFSVNHFGGKSATDFKKMKNDYYVSQDYFFQKHYGIFIGFVVKILRYIYLFVTNR